MRKIIFVVLLLLTTGLYAQKVSTSITVHAFNVLDFSDWDYYKENAPKASLGYKWSAINKVPITLYDSISTYLSYYFPLQKDDIYLWYGTVYIGETSNSYAVIVRIMDDYSQYEYLYFIRSKT